MKCIDKTPDLLETNIYLKRIARGRFAMAGNVTTGIDLTDETKISAEVSYSSTAQHFMLTPFHIPQTTLSKYINTYYKDFLLDELKECATNPPHKDASETFIPPLTKRVVVLENCAFSNENMPSHMRSGYYKLIISLTNQIDTTCSILSKIEPK